MTITDATAPYSGMGGFVYDCGCGPSAKSRFAASSKRQPDCNGDLQGIVRQKMAVASATEITPARQLVKTPEALEKKPAFSSLEQPHDFRFRQPIEVQIEADHRRRCVDLYVELVGLHGEHGEEITVRMVAGGGHGPP